MILPILREDTLSRLLDQIHSIIQESDGRENDTLVLHDRLERGILHLSSMRMAKGEREASTSSPSSPPSIPSKNTFFLLPPEIRNAIYDATFGRFDLAKSINAYRAKVGSLRIVRSKCIPIKLLLLNKRITEEVLHRYQNTCTYSLFSATWDEELAQNLR